MTSGSLRALRVLSTAVALLTLSESRLVLANTEPPAAYDARSVALGGTGSAYVHNGASPFKNPAALEGIGTFSVTGVISPSAPTTTVPLNGPNSSVKSDASVFPLFLVGGAYRLTDRLVLGVAVFPSAGFGSVYKGVATPAGSVDLEQKVSVFEATPALSFALTKQVAVGVAWRITHTSQSAEQLAPVAGPGPVPAMGKLEVDMSGTSYAGAHFGLFAKPTPTTRLSLTYRNRFTTHLDGTVTMAGQGNPASMDLPMPHNWGMGAAQELLGKRLLLVAEIKRSLYAEANKSFVTTIQTPMGDQKMVIPLDWNNTWTVGAGAEYWLTTTWAARIGYSAAQSATPEKRPSYYLPPPALMHTLHFGAGVKLGQFDIDAGGFYSFGGKDLTPAQTSPQDPNPGRYESTFLMGALSVTWRR
ncbi:MAG TPA: outer membrane protein transport protein [Polyangiaceae bacterium]|nr:outer membrane protein transport protein [Polyangiaceae bacterium]